MEFKTGIATVLTGLWQCYFLEVFVLKSQQARPDAYCVKPSAKQTESISECVLLGL